MHVIEFHVQTVCLLVIAWRLCEPTKRQFSNWRERRRLHRQHIKQLEESGL